MRFNNNPLNIRYVKKNNWIGQCGESHGFCLFTSFVYGVRAAIYLLFRSYLRYKRDITISEAISRFAPVEDGNDTKAYISFVCSKMNVSSDMQLRYLNKLERFSMVSAMCLMETKCVLKYSEFEQAYKMVWSL